MADTINSPMAAQCQTTAGPQFVRNDITTAPVTNIATPSNVIVAPRKQRQHSNGGNTADATDGGDGGGSGGVCDSVGKTSSPSAVPPDAANNCAPISIEYCSDPEGCLSLMMILKSFNVPISEEQGWALIYQSVRLYRDVCREQYNCKGRLKDIRVPMFMHNLNLHKDGSVHVNFNRYDTRESCDATSQKRILLNLAKVVYQALDYTVSSNAECIISMDLANVLNVMALEDIDDEGIERDSYDVEDDKIQYTKDLDHILHLCTPRVQPSNPNDHYRAVCRALVTESLELRVFLQQISRGDTEHLRIKADVETSKHELQKLGFGDWTQFWMQVVDELRRGIRLKKCNYTRAPLEFELTPYEILMEDIRSRNYELHKVMVDGDVPPRVKKDAHALILEFIRSRPPLKKASERKLPPPKWNPTPREQLLDSIRRGRPLKHIQQAQTVLPTAKLDSISGIRTESRRSTSQSPRHTQRLIKVDFSLFDEDEDSGHLDESGTSSLASNQSTLSNSHHQTQHLQHQQQHPQRYQHHNIENNPNNINKVVHRRKKDTQPHHDEYTRPTDNTLESYDLATCEARLASMRRHTIVGCQSNNMDCQSTPSSRPESRQSETSTTATMNPLNPLNPMTSAALDEWTKASTDSIDELPFKETVTGVSDRLALTLEEIVHIRSVMTKAELEGLPVGVRVKEDVENRKVCFLCLRTRFTIFGQWGVQCKLCQRTVCSKCYTKMRIPTEHFRNVPVVLLSPSLMSSPITSSAPSPCHHAAQHGTTSGPSNIMDDSFPRSLMDRLLRTESHTRTIHSMGSAPSSPKMQRSTSSTPGAPVHGAMTMSMGGLPVQINSNGVLETAVAGGSDSTASSNRNSIMSRSMEGPRSLPPQSPARPHSNNSTLDRRSRFSGAFSLSSSTNGEQKETLRGEMMAVCNDCRGLVYEIIRSSKQTRSSARNKALRNLTLDLSPVYKRW